MTTRENRAAFQDFRSAAYRVWDIEDFPTSDEIEALQSGIAADQRRRYAAAIRDRAAEAQDYN